jgi:transketolase
MGLASRGAIAFPSTFACFLTRAYDFIRMTAISRLNVKLAGSHAGVSIGEDGPSQMALEDLAMMRAQPNFAVLYPCDAVSAERLVAAAAAWEGPAYIRTSRPKTPVIYGPGELFPVGGCKVLRQSTADVATVIGAGVTVFEGSRPRRVDGGRRGHPRDRPVPISRSTRHAQEVSVATAAGRHRRGSLPGGIGDAVAAATTGRDGHILAVRDIRAAQARGAAGPLRHFGAPDRRNRATVVVNSGSHSLYA